jgi:hypothetical protein
MSQAQIASISLSVSIFKILDNINSHYYLLSSLNIFILVSSFKGSPNYTVILLSKGPAAFFLKFSSKN